MDNAQIKLLQTAQLNAMKYIHSFCEENGIKYYLIGGSALGAKRHGGFIPWDTDIDIAMMREDYDKFKKVCLEKLDKKFTYLDYSTTKNHFSPHALVRINNSVMRLTRDFLHKCDLTEIFIDIFPLDTAPLDVEKQKKQAKDIRKIYSVRERKCGYLNHNSKLEKAVKYVIMLLMTPVSYYRIGKMRENVLRRHDGENSNLVCSMCSHYSYQKQLMPFDVYGKPTLMKFETEQFYVPEKIDDYLTRIFGDYNKIPSPEEIEKITTYYEEVYVPEEFR